MLRDSEAICASYDSMYRNINKINCKNIIKREGERNVTKVFQVCL